MVNVTDTYDLTNIADYIILLIQAFAIPGIAVIGAVMNIVSIVIFSRCKRTDVSSTVQYLCVLAVFDLYNCLYYAVLMFPDYGMRVLTSNRFYINFQVFNDASCKFLRFTSLVSITMSSWILVLFSGERCMAVCTPLSIATFVTRKKRIVGALICLIISIGTWAITLTSFIVNYNSDNEPIGCFLDLSFNTVDRLIYFGITDGIGRVIPAFLITVFNTAICLTLLKRGKQVKKITADKNFNKTEKSCIKNLVGISVLYVVAIMPNEVIWSVFMAIDYHNSVSNNIYNLDWDMLFRVAKVGECFVVINFAFNFIIYSASLDFYQRELRKIIPCLKSITDTDNTTGGTLTSTSVAST